MLILFLLLKECVKNEIDESVHDISMDNLCQNSIELIKYARNITAKQVNNVQIMTYYSLGRWIVEVQQQGKHRAEYGKKIIINLSKKLTEEFGKGFSESTLEKARKFYLTYKNRISETLFTEFCQQFLLELGKGFTFVQDRKGFHSKKIISEWILFFITDC